jgi:hypothetical protein
LIHYKALLFIIYKAKKKANIDVPFIQKLSSIVMKNTGSVIHSIMGDFDSSKGDLRLVNVHAGSTRFIDFSKVPGLLESFCIELNEKLTSKIK